MTTKLSIRIFFAAFLVLIFAGLFWITDLALQKFVFKDLSPANPYETRRAIRLREISPNYSGQVSPDDPYEFNSLTRQQYKLETDNDGFIKPSKVHENPDLKIFFVGGSTTESLFVSENNRWPFLVGQILGSKSDRKINSYNGGVGGNNSLHSLNVILNKVIPLKADVIVFMENINDLTVLAYEKSYWNGNQFRSPVIDMRSSTSFYARVTRFIRNTLPGWFLVLRSVANKISPQNEFGHLQNSRIEVNADAIKLSFRKNLNAFVALARAYDVQPILMTQFNRLENGDVAMRKYLESARLLIPVDEYVNLYRSFNEEIRKVAKENNVKLIDLAKEIPGRAEFIYDAVHVNDTGSKLVAELIAGKLMAWGI